MTKTQLVKWLEMQRKEALKINRDLYLENIEEHNQKIYEELELYKYAELIQGHLDKAEDLVREWREKHKIEGIEYRDGYNSIASSLYQFTNNKNATFNSMKTNGFQDDTKQLFKIEQQYGNDREEIDRNYKNLIANIKSLKSAKVGMEYLEGLGFDLTELREQDQKPITALVAKIDTKYLLLNKNA